MITNFDSRPTMDIDFLMRNHSNDNEKISEMIDRVVVTNTGNGFIRFEIKSLESIYSKHPKN